jgi:putative flippase GtrA
MKNILTKILNDEIFKYLVAGVSATLLFFVVKMIAFNLLQNGAFSEIIAQAIAIIFAFFTNKFWVFEQTSNSLWQEFIKFVVSRLFVMLLSVVANWYLIDTNPAILTNLLHLTLTQTVLVLTIFLQVLTIVLNYIFSKFLIFTQK